MILFETKTYAKVWKVKSVNEKYIDLQLGTSEKNEDGTYRNSTWFARCIGKSANKVKDVSEGDTIYITKAKITNESVKQPDGSWRSYFNLLVFEANKVERNGSTSTPAPKASQPVTNKVEPLDDMELPF